MAGRTVPADYEERVYAGVLGKVIAVYLGRPFEGWTYERIMRELGEVTGYVNDRRDVALKHHLLVVTDDDISGTFVFPRALDDVAPGEPLDPRVVGRTWLNEIVPGRTVLWWGGLGNSTEHTAYLRMRDGVLPPRSGSAELNGVVVAEQVGAQIFCEGFAMTCPGDPAAAADLVERAASVSHDGEALQAARMVGALVAQAFVEDDVDRLLDEAVRHIDQDCLIRRVVDDVRSWSAQGDWHATRACIDEHYGYHRYGGNCHVVPNHAVVIAAIAHSGGDFGRAMTVVTTSGWDTDSNAGDVGSVMGVLGGLDGLSNGPDYRGPIADRLYLPVADGGSAVTDAATEALRLARHGRGRHGEQALVPKGGARFHFALPGAVQGFERWPELFDGLAADGLALCGVRGPSGDGAAVRHVTGADGVGRLEVMAGSARPTLALTPTFIPPEARDMPIYGLVASPTLYPGQVLSAKVFVPDDVADADVQLVLRHYAGSALSPDVLTEVRGPLQRLSSGGPHDLRWIVPDVGGQPIVLVGLAVSGRPDTVVHLDRLTWDGEPTVRLTRPADAGSMWRRAWVDAVDRFDDRWPEPYRIVQNSGFGQLVQGTRQWRDYLVTADVTPHLASAAGVAARVQGMERGYVLELADRDHVRLVRRYDGETELARVPCAWAFGTTYVLQLEVDGVRVRGRVDGRLVIDVVDHESRLRNGAIALTVRDGRTATQQVQVTPCSTGREPHASPTEEKTS
jgi:ADP-ribosylglycohydrolase